MSNKKKVITSDISENGYSIEYYETKAYRLPKEIITDKNRIFATWIEGVTDKIIDLIDQAQTFELEILFNQLYTHLSTFTGEVPPEPLEYPSYEQSTLLAYNCRRAKLIKAGLYTMPLEVDPENPMPRLPDNEYIITPPSLDTITDEEDKTNIISFIQEWIINMESSFLYQYYLEQEKLSRHLLVGLASDESWELIKEENGVKTWYRAEKEVATHSFRVVGTVHAKLIELFTLIYEAELFARWFPMMRDCHEIHEHSRYTKICQSTIAAIWPMSDRELLLDCSGVDDSLRGRVLINLRDLPKSSPHWFECSSSFVRCSMLSGGFMLTPLTPTETEVSFTTNVDPQLYLPASLLNLITGKMIGTMLQTMTQHAPSTQGPESPWYPQVQKHKLVYDFVDNAIGAFFRVGQDEEQAAETESAAVDNNKQ